MHDFVLLDDETRDAYLDEMIVPAILYIRLAFSTLVMTNMCSAFRELTGSLIESVWSLSVSSILSNPVTYLNRLFLLYEFSKLLGTKLLS